MAQIASLLAVATVFIGLWILIFTFYSQGAGGLIHETKLPMQELELGGLCARGGVYLRASTVLLCALHTPTPGHIHVEPN